VAISAQEKRVRCIADSGVPDLITLFMITDAGSRILFGLSSDRMAPRIFSHCTAKGIPVAGLALTAMFGLLAYMNVDTSGGTVFEWFSNISSITGLVTWWSILLVCLLVHLNHLFLSY
jgi:amino acid permease